MIIDPTPGWGRVGSRWSRDSNLETYCKLVIKCCLVCISCRIWKCIMLLNVILMKFFFLIFWHVYVSQRQGDLMTRVGFALSRALFRKKCGAIQLGRQTLFFLSPSAVSSPQKLATFFCSSLSFHSGVAHYFRHALAAAFVGAPVRPNMLNMPKSAAATDNVGTPDTRADMTAYKKCQNNDPHRWPTMTGRVWRCPKA